MKELLPVVSELYNYGQPPAFNLKENAESEVTVPDDFTLLPEWDKPKRRKQTKIHEVSCVGGKGRTIRTWQGRGGGGGAMLFRGGVGLFLR